MTHRDLTTLSATEVETELRDSQAWLKTQFGLPAVPSFASPYGAYNASVLTTVQKYYGSHRTVNGGQNFKDSNILQLRSHSVNSYITVDTVRGWIDSAAADGSWLILTFHQFVSGTPTQVDGVQPGRLRGHPRLPPDEEPPARHRRAGRGADGWSDGGHLRERDRL